jgi:hypothetical protein
MNRSLFRCRGALCALPIRLSGGLSAFCFFGAVMIVLWSALAGFGVVVVGSLRIV